MKTVATLAAACLLIAAPALSSDRLDLRVSSQVLSEPGTIRLTVRVSPHPENRLLTVQLDASDYYRSSTVQLEGAEDTRTRTLAYSNLPAGDYVATVRLRDTTGTRAQAQQTFVVVGFGR